MYLVAFSVKQPWASLILAGVKQYEVRSWAPVETGLVLLHASSSKAPGMPALRTNSLYQQAIALAGMEDERAWPQSALLGLVEIACIIAPEEARPSGLSDVDAYLGGDAADAFLWEIGERWVFPTPVPCKGRLQLWTPPEELHAALDAQLAAVGAPVRMSD